MSGGERFYYERVKLGVKKWTEVPSLWKDKVVKNLKNDGYTLNKDGTVTAKED